MNTFGVKKTMTARMLKGTALLSGMFVVQLATAQVPDLLNALDTGGRAMGVGGATSTTDASPQSALDNPAGLAYVKSPTTTLVLRNLPKSTTTIGGTFTDRSLSTRAGSGRTALSHFGYAMPYRKGTLGFSYTIGGFIDDLSGAANLPNGATSIRNLREERKAQTDFFTFSYGESRGSINYGFGIVVANQYTKFSQEYQVFDAGNQQVGSTNTTASDNGIGVGLVVGAQGSVGNGGSQTWGASVRTPINIQNNTDTAGIYDQIPGKLSVGTAGRLDQFARGSDFLVWGAEVDYYFGGQGNKVFARDNYFGFGLGVEYSYHRGDDRFPIRLGYQYSPSGGDGFSDRNALTFGLGYRPANRPYSVDLSFARPSKGSQFDFALGVTYRPTK